MNMTPMAVPRRKARRLSSGRLMTAIAPPTAVDNPAKVDNVIAHHSASPNIVFREDTIKKTRSFRKVYCFFESRNLRSRNDIIILWV